MYIQRLITICDNRFNEISIKTNLFMYKNNIYRYRTLRDAYSWHLDSHLDLVTYFQIFNNFFDTWNKSFILYRVIWRQLVSPLHTYRRRSSLSSYFLNSPDSSYHKSPFKSPTVNIKENFSHLNFIITKVQSF